MGTRVQTIQNRKQFSSHENLSLYTCIKLPNDTKHTFPDLIRLVGRESQEIVSVTLRLDTEGTGPEFPFCFADKLSFGGEVLAGVGELL